MNSTLYISKLDAAKRQLLTAIRLFKYDEDFVSIHTLTMSSNKILYDLLKKNKIQTPHDEQMSFIKKERRNEVQEKLFKAKNYFKHANNDHSEILEFNPEINAFYIQQTCEMYNKLTKENEMEFTIFLRWFFAKYPDILNSDRQFYENLPSELGVKVENKIEFFNAISKLFEFGKKL